MSRTFADVITLTEMPPRADIRVTDICIGPVPWDAATNIDTKNSFIACRSFGRNARLRAVCQTRGLLHPRKSRNFQDGALRVRIFRYFRARLSPPSTVSRFSSLSAGSGTKPDVFRIVCTLNLCGNETDLDIAMHL